MIWNLNLLVFSREIQDLNRGHDFLSHLLTLNNVALFDDMQAALNFAADWVHAMSGDESSEALHMPLSSSLLGTDFSALLVEARRIFNHHTNDNQGLYLLVVP